MAKTFVAALVLLAVSIGGCAAQVGEAPPDPCAAFNQCTTAPGALTTCNDGECACITNHPGENASTTCNENGDSTHEQK